MYDVILKKKIRRLPLDFEDTSLANKTAKQILARMKSEKKLHVFICGGTGTGKSFAAVEMLKIIWRRQYPGKLVLFQNETHQLNSYELTQYAKGLSNYRGLLVLDELFYESSHEKMSNSIYVILNNRFIERLPTIITTNFSIDDISGGFADPRVVDRIHGYCFIIKNSFRPQDSFRRK